MNVSVLLEQLNDNAYRATSLCAGPIGGGKGGTRQQAVDQIREMICDKLSNGEVIQVEVPGKAETKESLEGPDRHLEGSSGRHGY